MLTREQVAQRTAMEFSDGDRVHLGAGLPSLCAPLVAAGVQLSAPGESGPDTPVDVAVLGSSQVNMTGELASETAPEGRDAAAGVRGAKRIIVMMEHSESDGTPHILEACSLPLTGARVQRIITNLAVIDVLPEGLVLREVADGISARDVQEKTGAPLLAAPDMGLMKT